MSVLGSNFEGGVGENADSKKTKKVKKDKGKGGCLRFCKKSSGESGDEVSHQDFQSMNEHERKERIQQLWNRARRYNNKLRF